MSLVLDPRIGYQGLLADAASEPEMLDLIEDHKKDLEAYYNSDYAGRFFVPTTNGLMCPPADPTSPTKINFTAHYVSRMNRADRNALYPESFEDCDPVQWWGRRAIQFSNPS